MIQNPMTWVVFVFALAFLFLLQWLAKKVNRRIGLEPKRQETSLVKLVYVVVFLVSTIGTFFATEQFSAWVKLKSDVLAMIPIQLILVMLPMYLLSIVEGRVLWRLTRQDIFYTVYPVTMGVCVGYLLHY